MRGGARSVSPPGSKDQKPTSPECSPCEHRALAIHAVSGSEALRGPFTGCAGDQPFLAGGGEVPPCFQSPRGQWRVGSIAAAMAVCCLRPQSPSPVCSVSVHLAGAPSRAPKGGCILSDMSAPTDRQLYGAPPSTKETHLKLGCFFLSSQR